MFRDAIKSPGFDSNQTIHFAVWRFAAEMGTTRESMISSSGRPLFLRMRPDLICNRQTYQGRDYWIVKDPVALRYYRFEEEEFALLRMLDGRKSADDIQFQFNQKFAPQKLSLGELYQLTGMLYRSSLLLSSAADQGRELFKRGAESQRRIRRARWTNVLAIQFRGFDPDGILMRIERWVGWFFSAPAVYGVMSLACAATILLLTHWDAVQNRLPEFREFFAYGNWFWLVATLAVSKILHELGHGVSCRRFGGQVHEMGLMLLVVTPCLYVNVSDSWTIPSKWKRIGIAAAGMYVELFLASLAVLVWWFTYPGLVNQLALNTVFVCSISTLVFNANPLMKYDGYYILSDWLEIPNLRQKATSIVQRAFSTWTLGLESPPDPFLPSRNRWFFVLYSVASIAYRWFITLAIAYFLYTVLEPYGFKIIGQFLALVILMGLVVGPLIRGIKFLCVPGRISQVNRTRATIAASALGIALLAICWIPVPHYVWCELYVQPADAAVVYVKAPGRIRRILVAPNQYVEAGTVLVELENLELESEVSELIGRTNVAHVRLQSAMHVANYDPAFSSEVDTANASYTSLTQLTEQRNADLEKLVVRAPVSGRLLAADYQAKPNDDDGTLNSWHGRALDPRNLGAYLLEGTKLAQIAPDPGKLEAILAIDQGDIEFIAAGQPVEIWIRQHPGQTYAANINLVSLSEMKSVPACLSTKFGGRLPTITAADESEKPTSTMFRVSVPFKDAAESITSGSSGRARVRVGYRTLGQRAWRLICKTIRFDL